MRPWEGSFEMVNPREIVVDHRYQRPQKPDLIAIISGNANWEDFGCIVCFKRGTIFYCIDGQQRLAGVLASEEPPRLVPVIWHVSKGVQHEASVFDAINRARKALQALETFKALLEAKNPLIVQVAATVERAGFSIGANSGSPRTLASIKAYMDVHRLYGEETGFYTLIAIRDAWTDDRMALSSGIIKAIGEIVGEGNGDRKNIAKALARTSPSKILREAEGLRFDLGGSRQINIRRAFKKLAKI